MSCHRNVYTFHCKLVCVVKSHKTQYLPYQCRLVTTLILLGLYIRYLDWVIVIWVIIAKVSMSLAKPSPSLLDIYRLYSFDLTFQKNYISFSNLYCSGHHIFVCVRCIICVCIHSEDLPGQVSGYLTWLRNTI